MDFRGKILSLKKEGKSFVLVGIDGVEYGVKSVLYVGSDFVEFLSENDTANAQVSYSIPFNQISIIFYPYEREVL